MTILEQFERYKGTREYDGIVRVIQEWFYGYFKEDAWCATSVSYFAAQCGILDQIGGKNEGVWEMYNKCKVAHKGGRFYDYGDIPDSIPRGAIVFLLRKGASHVTVAYESRTYNQYNYLACLGGNQSDMIRVSNYPMGQIQAVFVPEYPEEKKTGATAQSGLALKVLEKGVIARGTPEIYTFQRITKSLGYYTMEVDGSYGAGSKAACERFQQVHGLDVDGICGPITWKELLTKTTTK